MTIVIDHQTALLTDLPSLQPSEGLGALLAPCTVRDISGIERRVRPDDQGERIWVPGDQRSDLRYAGAASR